MNKQQELFEQFREMEIKLRTLSSAIQNDFEATEKPNFDCWYDFCMDSERYEEDLHTLLDDVAAFIHGRSKVNNLSIEELQRWAAIGIEAAIIELGRRVVDYDFEGEDHTTCEDEENHLWNQILYLQEENDNSRHDVSRLRQKLGLK